jgi:hypothetical protein
MSEPVTSGIKIIVPIEASDERGIDTESLWSERVTADTFRLRNSPFFAFDLSADDIVRAEKVGNDWLFREVVTRSGHSTYRIYLQGDSVFQDEDIQQAWQPIAALGAAYENANDRFFAVDIPPGKDVTTIYNLFEQGEEAGLWEFEEAHYEPTDESTDEPL